MIQKPNATTERLTNGRHSKKEYIYYGAYLIPQSRRGNFQASDTNNDGYVITDEAKLIFSQMDTSNNNRLTAMEFSVVS